LGLKKLEKMTKVKLSMHLLYTSHRYQVGADIAADHQRLGLVEKRGNRKNHRSTAALLAVPRYSDLLKDIDDEDETERGRALVTSEAGWRTEMAKWIGDARLRAENESDAEPESDDEDLITPARSRKWSPCKLSVLFGGEVARPDRHAQMEFDEEAALMEALADQEEDEYPDDGAMEGSGDDFE
jgi:hypothetical protein